jgi:hypothetical protein
MFLILSSVSIDFDHRSNLSRLAHLVLTYPPAYTRTHLLLKGNVIILDFGNLFQQLMVRGRQLLANLKIFFQLLAFILQRRDQTFQL